MPAVNNPNAHLSDIGGATSKVLLGVWASDLYQADGVTPVFSSGHMGGYQESWVDQQSTQLAPRSHYARLYPAEHWVQQWDVVSPNWETVDVGGMNGLKLITNMQPDAPRQTLVYGRAQPFGRSNDMPDICVPNVPGAYPLPSEYISVDPNVGPVIPGGGGGGAVIGTPQAMYEPGIDGSMGTPMPPGQESLKTQIIFSDVPFKPSSTDFIADSGSNSANYKTNIIGRLGIQLWNIWEMVNPSPSVDGRRYLTNHGPIWGSTTYAGPVTEQVGSVGNLRVRVTANRGMATMRRKFPVYQDIGRDWEYPWIFPFIGPGAGGSSVPAGGINHEIQSWGSFAERVMKHDGSEADGGPPPPNVGFILNMDITSEAQRGFFAGSGGGSPSVSVSWGDGTQSDRWATGFTAYIAPNKVPYLLYHDGVKQSRIYLAQSPVPPTMSSVKLRVEYHGVSMYVWFGETGTPICVRGYNNWSGGERWGVYVAGGGVQFTVSNCTATFDFMPVYYNPWSPTQTVDFYSGDISLQPPSNPDFDFYHNPRIETGMAALLNIGQFHLPCGATGAQAGILMARLQQSMLVQSPRADELASSSQTWGNKQAVPSVPFFHQDEGWPVMMRDSRQVDCTSHSGVQNANAYLPVVPYDMQYVSAYPLSSSPGKPTIMSTDSMTVNVLFRANVTHTTPLVLGFKADDDPPPSPVSGSSIYATLSPTSWDVNWRSEEGDVGCIMRAEAKVTVVNPDPDVILAVANNQMRIQITQSGYAQWASALPANTKLRQAVWADKPIFDGITVGLSVNRTSSGKVVMTIDAVDPMMMLEKAMLETNLRFDGCNYVTAFCLLFRHTDYASALMVRLRQRNNPSALPGVPGRLVGGHWLGAQRADEWFPELMATHYFGYSPTTGRAYEVPAGTFLMAALRGLMSKMSTPDFVPLFYYDPTSTTFVLTKRGIDDTKGLWPGSSGGVGTLVHPWIFDSPVMISATGFGTDSLAAGLMMQAGKGDSLYTLESSTRLLTSHYLAFGTNRATGTPVKATAVNPRWNYLKGLPMTEWSNVYGHIGYRAKVKDESPTFISDQRAALKYCNDRMWWLMRPVLKLSNITVDGMIFPGGEGGGLADGTVGIVTGDELFQNAFLDTATIHFDAEDQRVKSIISCYVFPRV